MEKYIKQLESTLSISIISPIQNKTEIVGRYRKNGKAVAVNLYEGQAEINQRLVNVVLERGK